MKIYKISQFLQQFQQNEITVPVDVFANIDKLILEYPEDGWEEIKKDLNGKICFAKEYIETYDGRTILVFVCGPMTKNNSLLDIEFPENYLRELLHDFPPNYLDLDCAENAHEIDLTNMVTHINPEKIWNIIRQRFLRSGFVEI